MTTVANSRILFIHIPKTGGSWVEQAMESGGVEFEAIADVPHPERALLNTCDRFVFGFVREPLSWYRSVWTFHRRLPQLDWPPITDSIDLDFPHFLEEIAEKSPGYLAAYYRQFVGPPNDEIDFIGHHEQLADELVTALRLAGQDFDEDALRAKPRVNRSLRKETMPGVVVPDCPATLKARVMESEHEVYERFYMENSSLTVAPSSTGRSNEAGQSPR